MATVTYFNASTPSFVPAVKRRNAKEQSDLTGSVVPLSTNNHAGTTWRGRISRSYWKLERQARWGSVAHSGMIPR